MLTEPVEQGLICDGCQNRMRNLPHLDRDLLCTSSVTINIFQYIFWKIWCKYFCHSFIFHWCYLLIAWAGIHFTCQSVRPSAGQTRFSISAGWRQQQHRWPKWGGREWWRRWRGLGLITFFCSLYPSHQLCAASSGWRNTASYTNCICYHVNLWLR